MFTSYYSVIDASNHHFVFITVSKLQLLSVLPLDFINVSKEAHFYYTTHV